MHDWILAVIEGGGYGGVLLLMALENVFPPIPSELIMGVAGIAVAQGRMEVAPLMVAGAIGSTLGNWVWYALGRALGYERLAPFVRRWGRWLTLDWAGVQALVRFFRGHGQWLVFAIRFAPVMRTMISLPAGLSRMPQPRFLAFTCAGTAVWNALLIGAGYWLERNFAAIDRVLGPVATVTMLAIGALHLWRVATWTRRTGPDGGMPER